MLLEGIDSLEALKSHIGRYKRLTRKIALVSVPFFSNSKTLNKEIRLFSV